MSENRHVVDQLADVRSEIKKLQAREATLREHLLSGECALIGDEHVASVGTQTRSRLDIAAVRAHFGEKALVPFMVVKEVRQVWVKAKKN